MLLPHGYEGQGPEHSSARLERFLQLCAEENMQVLTPTTPAQIFHALRRQAVRPIRKPMIVMSPKSLLRHKLATSTLDELATGTFQTVIDEVDQVNKSDVTRIVLCGGKVYYDLLEKRREAELNNVAIVRIEQLYPYPEQRLAEILAAYPNVKELVWCQEEPKNQGAWLFIAPRLYDDVLKSGKQIRISYAGREASLHRLVVQLTCMQNNRLSSSMMHLQFRLTNQERLNNGNRNQSTGIPRVSCGRDNCDMA